AIRAGVRAGVLAAGPRGPAPRAGPGGRAARSWAGSAARSRWLWGCGSRLSWALLGRIFGRRRTPHRACMAMIVQSLNDQNQSVGRTGAETEMARRRRGGREVERETCGAEMAGWNA